MRHSGEGRNPVFSSTSGPPAVRGMTNSGIPVIDTTEYEKDKVESVRQRGQDFTRRSKGCARICSMRARRPEKLARGVMDLKIGQRFFVVEGDDFRRFDFLSF